MPNPPTKRKEYNWNQAKLNTGEDVLVNSTDQVFNIIENRLWQAGMPVDQAKISQLGIDAVIDLEGTVDPVVMNYNGKFVYVYWPIADSSYIPDQGNLTSLVDYIDLLIKRDKRVLVHCAAGINRSSFVNALVLRRHYGWTAEQAIRHIRLKRPGALTNETFMNFLRNYHF
jgi:protein-tyrosine phosphatase